MPLQLWRGGGGSEQQGHCARPAEVQYSTVQHSTVQYSTAQYSTVLYCVQVSRPEQRGDCARPAEVLLLPRVRAHTRAVASAAHRNQARLLLSVASIHSALFSQMLYSY